LATQGAEDRFGLVEAFILLQHAGGIRDRGHRDPEPRKKLDLV
jgi:hypothetical protein